MSSPHPDLELALHRRDGQAYSLEMRFSDPASEVDRTFTGTTPVRLDARELRQRSADAAAYGDYLGSQLLAEPAGRSFFDQAVAVSETNDQPLRVRLAIGPSAPELHSLRWETLRLPGAVSPLLTGETLRFSRYLSSMDWRQVTLRPEGELRALVVAADPSDLARYQLSPVDTAAEEAAARAGLGPIHTDALAARGQATLDNLSKALRETYDIVYLVAHGLLVDGEPWLFLEQPDGTADRVPGSELATRLREAQQRPRLVVLASCQSAGAGADPTTDTADALLALGPRLAEAGAPAVIAMQGNITVETVSQFMPVLFEELRRDGSVDRAVAAARGAVRQRPDWWMPVLFMRLRSGRISYRPGFGDDAQGLRKWPALLNNIQSGRCTPILGPGTSEWLFGSRREIAERWAETFAFPMSDSGRESLPQVTQYVAVDQDLNFMRQQLMGYLRQQALRHLGDAPPADQDTASLDELISAAGAIYASQHEAETYRVLASLPLPIYITTNPGNLLGDALAAAGLQADRRAAVGLPPLRPPQRSRYGGVDRGRLLRLPDRRHQQQRSDPAGRAPGTDRHGLALSRLQPGGMGFPRALPQHHAARGTQPPRPLCPYRRADRPGARPDSAGGCCPALPGGVLRRRGRQHLLGQRRRFRR